MLINFIKSIDSALNADDDEGEDDRHEKIKVLLWNSFNA